MHSITDNDLYAQMNGAIQGAVFRKASRYGRLQPNDIEDLKQESWVRLLESINDDPALKEEIMNSPDTHRFVCALRMAGRAVDKLIRKPIRHGDKCEGGSDMIEDLAQTCEKNPLEDVDNKDLLRNMFQKIQNERAVAAVVVATNASKDEQERIAGLVHVSASALDSERSQRKTDAGRKRASRGRKAMAAAVVIGLIMAFLPILVAYSSDSQSLNLTNFESIQHGHGAELWAVHRPQQTNSIQHSQDIDLGAWTFGSIQHSNIQPRYMDAGLLDIPSPEMVSSIQHLHAEPKASSIQHHRCLKNEAGVLYNAASIQHIRNLAL